MSTGRETSDGDAVRTDRQGFCVFADLRTWGGREKVSANSIVVRWKTPQHARDLLSHPFDRVPAVVDGDWKQKLGCHAVINVNNLDANSGADAPAPCGLGVKTTQDPAT